MAAFAVDKLKYAQRKKLTRVQWMTPPSEKLAGSLNALRSLQDRGVVAVRATELARTHRERLVRHGFLRPVMKGWYIAGSPNQDAGDSTAWYASFWSFCAGYLRARFGERWCLYAGAVPGAPRGQSDRSEPATCTGAQGAQPRQRPAPRYVPA